MVNMSEGVKPIRILLISCALLTVFARANESQSISYERLRCAEAVRLFWQELVKLDPTTASESVSAHYNRKIGTCLVIATWTQPRDTDWPLPTVVTKVYDLYEQRTVVWRRHFKGGSPNEFAYFYWQSDEEWHQGTDADRKRFRDLIGTS